LAVQLEELAVGGAQRRVQSGDLLVVLLLGRALALAGGCGAEVAAAISLRKSR